MRSPIISTPTPFTNPPDRLILPFLGPFYDYLAQPLGWALFRVLIGGALIYEGLPKILAPFAQIGFVESLHFYPGWFWSPVLAIMQFFGGMAIAVGLFTRPIALANAVMLAITLWFHHTHPYGEAILSPAGVEFMKTNGAQYLAPEAIQKLADGGGAFLKQVQEKAEMLSLIWTGAAALLAAFGGGYWSVDRFLKKQF